MVFYAETAANLLAKPPDGRVILRWIWLLDNKDILVRGSRESLAGDIAMSGEKAQGFSLVIENCRVLAGRAGIPAAKEFWTDSPLGGVGHIGSSTHVKNPLLTHFLWLSLTWGGVVGLVDIHLDFRELLLAR